MNHMDLENMPLHEKLRICQILDRNDKWIELAKLMQFSDFDIANFEDKSQRLRKSPADLLISRWSSRYAHNVTELFKLLSLMQQFEAMHVIKKLVHVRYHVWFRVKIADESKIFNCDTQRDAGIKPTQPTSLENEIDNIPKFPFEKLVEATNNWAVKLGSGGFGTVYKGKLTETIVAVKKLQPPNSSNQAQVKPQQLSDTLNELILLNRIRHDNILDVFGYSTGTDGCWYVVYKFMAGGSLQSRLRRLNETESLTSLTWPERLVIAIGTARGLNYCHCYDSQRPLIHGDIKPANILIDSFGQPKIGDFGLSYECNSNECYEERSKAMGTRAYLPKEVRVRRLFSTKFDVFSFGVVLCELSTGYKSHDNERALPFLYDHITTIDEDSLETIMRVIDPKEPNDLACFNLCRLLILNGKQCTAENPNNRPEMIQVLKSLERFKPLMIFGCNF